MFNLGAWLIDKLLMGYQTGAFTDVQVGIYAANYLAKGWISQDDFNGVVVAIAPPAVEE